MSYRILGETVKSVPGTEFGLSARDMVAKISNDHIAVIKDRKSRLIMKDGRIFLVKAQAVSLKFPGIRVSLATNAPVCSKTVKFLLSNGIDTLKLEKS